MPDMYTQMILDDFERQERGEICKELPPVVYSGGCGQGGLAHYRSTYLSSLVQQQKMIRSWRARNEDEYVASPAFTQPGLDESQFMKESK